MEAILIEYLSVIVVLVMLEGLLAVDNAVVMAVMVKHLPKEQQKKALFYGLFGAFIFRFIALFLIAILAKYWQIQALGALYLFFVTFKHFWNKKHIKEKVKKESKGSGFWMTVLKVELTDIAFAIDSMLASVAIAITLPAIGNWTIGGINAGVFAVMLIGGMIGIILMRFASTKFIRVLEKHPHLEDTAFLIVGWVGVKLAVMVLGHEQLAIIDTQFAHSTTWKIIFWAVLIGIVIVGWFKKPKPEKKDEEKERICNDK